MPARLATAGALGARVLLSAALSVLRAWAAATDDICFCGMAVCAEPMLGLRVEVTQAWATSNHHPHRKIEVTAAAFVPLSLGDEEVTDADRIALAQFVV